MRYMHDGKGGAITAGSAAEAALVLARRMCGGNAKVESFHFAGRTWQNLDCAGPKSGGAGYIRGKAWTAVLISVPTEEQLYWGGACGHERYVHKCVEVHITEGAVRADDKAWVRTRYPRRPIMGGGQTGGHDTRHAARGDVVCGGVADLPTASPEEVEDLTAQAEEAWRVESACQAGGAAEVWRRRAEQAAYEEWTRWAARNRRTGRMVGRRVARRQARCCAAV